MLTNSQQNRLRFDATPKKQLADTLSTFSQTEVTVQPSAKKSSTVMSSIFAKEIRAIPSTSKQINGCTGNYRPQIKKKNILFMGKKKLFVVFKGMKRRK
jgi:uncharacterized membrane-anchored protein